MFKSPVDWRSYVDFVVQYFGDDHNPSTGNPILNQPVFEGTTQGLGHTAHLFLG